MTQARAVAGPLTSSSHPPSASQRRQLLACAARRQAPASSPQQASATQPRQRPPPRGASPSSSTPPPCCWPAHAQQGDITKSPPQVRLGLGAQGQSRPCGTWLLFFVGSNCMPESSRRPSPLPTHAPGIQALSARHNPTPEAPTNRRARQRHTTAASHSSHPKPCGFFHQNRAVSSTKNRSILEELEERASPALMLPSWPSPRRGVWPFSSPPPRPSQTPRPFGAAVGAWGLGCGV